MSQSRGFFDWVPEQIGYGYIRMAVQVELDFNKIKPHMRKKLRTAIETGMLPSFGGQLAAMYRTIAWHYGWPRPHLWTASDYVGCRIYMPKHHFIEKVAPFLAVLAANDQSPAYFGNPMTGYGGMKSVQVGQSWGNKSMRGKVTPDNVVQACMDMDGRPPNEVQDVLRLIDNRECGYYRTLIS